MKLFQKMITVSLVFSFLITGLTACSTPNDALIDYAMSKKSEKDSKSIEERSPEDDTILWINGTYAILTSLNGWDYMIYAGQKYSPSTESIYQSSLEEWWGIEDRESADSTLDWVLDEGHRTEFAYLMELFESEGIANAEEETDPAFFEYYTENYPELTEEEVINAAYLYQYYDMEEDEAAHYADSYTVYLEYGSSAIDAWDYSRAVYLPSMYYLAGYYTEEEAKQKSLDIAREIQKMYTSWDDFTDSYLRGYEYWAEESSDDRREIYEEIKADPNGPYSLDWDMQLTDFSF